MIGNIVNVINRTEHDLNYTVDGRQYTLHPGRQQMLSNHIKYAKSQNPVPGSADPYAPSEFESLIAVEGTSDPSDELTDDILAMLPKERFDRSRLPPDRQRVEERKNPVYPTRRIGQEAVTPEMIAGDTFRQNR